MHAECTFGWSLYPVVRSHVLAGPMHSAACMHAHTLWSWYTAEQDSVRLLTVEGCGPLARLLNKEDAVRSILPIVQSFSQVGPWTAHCQTACLTGSARTPHSLLGKLCGGTGLLEQMRSCGLTTIRSQVPPPNSVRCCAVVTAIRHVQALDAAGNRTNLGGCDTMWHSNCAKCVMPLGLRFPGMACTPIITSYRTWTSCASLWATATHGHSAMMLVPLH